MPNETEEARIADLEHRVAALTAALDRLSAGQAAPEADPFDEAWNERKE